MFPVGFTGCIGQVVFSTLWACWASRHKESLYEDSIYIGHNVSQKSQRVACIVCEFAVSQVGTRGQSGYTRAESSLSAQGIVTSVHESTHSAGSIHAGGKGLAGSPMPSPYVEAVRIEDCLIVRHRPAFVCFGIGKKGAPLSKQRLAHWVADSIVEEYRATGCVLPATVKCHSTRGVATSYAALRGVPLSEICAAATWESPCTFTRFNRLHVSPSSLISSAILSENVWAYIFVTWLYSSSPMYWPSLAVWNSEIERWLLE